MSGDKNEEQVLNAIEAYTEHRPEITSRAINLLFDIARIERCSQLLRALQVSLGLTLGKGILHSQSFFPPRPFQRKFQERSGTRYFYFLSTFQQCLGHAFLAGF